MTLLLLAGTSDARRIATLLAEGGHPAIASLAGVTRDPVPLPIETRVGGFGGAEGFHDFIRAETVTAVVDATHPFAARISDRTAEICAMLGLPYLYYLRPAWEPEPGDQWSMIDREEDAAALIPDKATVFLGTGRQTLERFRNLEGRRVICRQIDPPDAPFPFEGGEFLIGRPPFPVARERALFAALGIDWLVVKNAGGDASRTKLTAARQMGLPVAMIRRPSAPEAPRAASASEVMDWVRRL